MGPPTAYLDAMRAVRPSQALGRARRLVPASVLAAGMPPTGGWRPLAAGLVTDPAPQGGPSSGLDGGTYRAVGVARRTDAADLWTDASDGLLFLFHLHAFAGIGDPGLIADWLRRCARPGGPGWHPFPLSGRLIAWSVLLSERDDLPAEEMRASMRRQLVYLRRSVEHDVGGNHVLRNATALVVAGHCLGDGRAATRGERLLAREVGRQLLPDGGHEERSPSYHREVLADLTAAAMVLERAGRAVPWRPALGRMQAWLAALAAPDGSLPLLNDAWEGPPVSPAGAAVAELDGLVVLRGRDLHVVLDCAPLGPAHLPPHIHADALSFTLWRDGRWLVADPGAYTYAGPDRDAFRGTAAHATVTVGGADQCRFWGPFRATRLPTVAYDPIERRDDGWIVVRARHDGYRPAVHHRVFSFHPEHGLVVEDRVEGAGDVVSRLPLAPGTDPALVEPAAERVASRYAPYLGTAVPTSLLVQRGPVTRWAILRSSGRTRPTG